MSNSKNFVAKNGLDTGGNINLTSTSQRITADFSNGTLASRTMLQTSTTNGVTSIGILPNGSALSSSILAYNLATPTNASFTLVGVDSTTSFITAYAAGSGTALPLVFNTGNAERLRIDTAGNLGIGKSSSLIAKIDIIGTSGTPIIAYSDGTIAGVTSYTGSGLSLIGTTSNHPLAFLTNNSEKIRIGTSGEIGIGGANYGTSGQVLTSGGTGAAPTWASASGGGGTVTDDTTTNSTYYPTFATTTSGTLSAKVSSTKLTFNPSTGTLFSTIVSTSSDERLKDNIETVTNGLDIIKQINPVSFDWKVDGAKGYGVIAQEIEKLLPELIEDGEYKSVKYDYLFAFLISAVKELASKLEK